MSEQIFVMNIAGQAQNYPPFTGDDEVTLTTNQPEEDIAFVVKRISPTIAEITVHGMRMLVTAEQKKLDSYIAKIKSDGYLSLPKGKLSRAGDSLHIGEYLLVPDNPKFVDDMQRLGAKWRWPEDPNATAPQGTSKEYPQRKTIATPKGSRQDYFPEQTSRTAGQYSTVPKPALGAVPAENVDGEEPLIAPPLVDNVIRDEHIQRVADGSSQHLRSHLNREQQPVVGWNEPPL